jgi:hypothetical protein
LIDLDRLLDRSGFLGFNFIPSKQMPLVVLTLTQPCCLKEVPLSAWSREESTVPLPGVAGNGTAEESGIVITRGIWGWT